MEQKRAWIYCRTAYPDDHCLAVQQACLEAFAKERGFMVTGITAEHGNGVGWSRRGLLEVSSAVDAGKVDVLLIQSITRLGRDSEQVDAYLHWPDLLKWSVPMVRSRRAI